MIKKIIHRLKLLWYGVDPLKKKHLQQITNLELGWRATFELESKKTEEIRNNLHLLILQLSNAMLSDMGNPRTLTMQLRFDERIMFPIEPFDPHSKHLIHFLAREIAMAIEKEMNTINFSTLQGHMRNAERRHYNENIPPAYLWGAMGEKP